MRFRIVNRYVCHAGCSGCPITADGELLPYSLIVTAKIDGVDPQAWLPGILAHIAAHPAHRLDELLP